MISTPSFVSIAVYPHHMKQTICGSRAKYRDGRKDTAVKVYTVNQESVYLLISNVPAVGGAEELRALCDQYGIVNDFQPLDDYPCEEFTEVYLVKYQMFPAARTAKKHLDDKSFLGGTLHVFYAPEFESVLETKLKLQERRKYVAWKTNTGKKYSSATDERSLCTSVQSQSHTQKRSMSSSSIDPLQQQPVTYVWAGKEYTVYPQTTVPDPPKPKASSSTFVPRQLLSKSFSGGGSDVNRGLVYLKTDSRPREAESSYQNTISNVRKRVSNVSVPNVRVSTKRRKRL